MTGTRPSGTGRSSTWSASRQEVATTPSRTSLSPWRLRKRAEVARKLDRGLARTPLRGLGALLEQVGWQEHVNPGVMAAAAGTESSFGAAGCADNPKNIWGLASCGSGWHVPYFRTWGDAFLFYARFLKHQWPNAVDVYGLHGYSANDTAWGNRTTHFAAMLGFSNRMCYPC